MDVDDHSRHAINRIHTVFINCSVVVNHPILCPFPAVGSTKLFTWFDWFALQVDTSIVILKYRRLTSQSKVTMQLFKAIFMVLGHMTNFIQIVEHRAQEKLQGKFRTYYFLPWYFSWPPGPARNISLLAFKGVFKEDLTACIFADVRTTSSKCNCDLRDI